MDDKQLDIVNLETGYLGLPPSVQLRRAALDSVARSSGSTGGFWREVEAAEKYLRSGEVPDA